VKNNFTVHGSFELGVGLVSVQPGDAYAAS
jgi:hypothetical protein